VVVVDESGIVKALARMDGSWLSALQVAQDKAYSAAATTAPTAVWRKVAADDPELGFGLAAIDRLSPLGGGVPLVADGTVVGAIGVSRGSIAQDTDVAEHAIAAVSL
jgi:glc operon protein GlcG